MRDSYFCYLCIQTFTSKEEFEDHFEKDHSRTVVFFDEDSLTKDQEMATQDILDIVEGVKYAISE